MHNLNSGGRTGGLHFYLTKIFHLNARRKKEKVKSSIATRLDLDESQSDELDSLLTSINQITAGSGYKTTEALEKAADLIIDPQFDHDTARAVVADVTASYESKIAEAVANFGKLYDTLNETQRHELRAFAAGRRWHATP